MEMDRSFLWLRKFLQNQDRQFWTIQVLGWLGYSLVTFFALTVWDDNVSWRHVGHIALQAALGMLCCWPLRPLYRWAFTQPMLQRLLISGTAMLALSWVWTASRLEAFMFLSGETKLWREFNDWYFGSLFVFISWTAIFFGMKYYQLFQVEHEKLELESARQRDEYLRRREAESLMRDAQLQMLRYQLNPHFLFKTLNALNAMIRLGMTSNAENMIEQLSKFLRHSLDTDAQTTVSLDEELYAIGLYLDIEQARFEDRLTVHFHVDPEARSASVPSLILQPLIENAMKYAIAQSEAGGVIEISAIVDEGRLKLDVCDSGPGMAAEKLVGERGIGFRNTLNRLEVLYGSDYEFETFSNQPAGLRVHIDIPLTFVLQKSERLGFA
jgi:two-component system LytT family sensor kinase